MRESNFTRKSLYVAVLAVGLTTSAVAGDLGISGNSMSVNNAGGGFSDVVSISASGVIDDVTGIPNSGTLDFPTFSFTLAEAGVADGTYTFRGGLIFDDENSDRRLEILIPTITMSFSGSNLTGSVNASQSVTVIGRNADGSIQATANVSSGGGASFDEDSLSFNADDALASIASGGGILADIITTIDTASSGNYSYGLFLKQTSGSENIRFGTDVTTSFTQFPCTNGSAFELQGGAFASNFSGAEGLQGQLKFAGSSGSLAAGDPTIFTASTCATYVPPSTPPTGGEEPETPAEVDDETDTVEDQLESEGVTTQVITNILNLAQNTRTVATTTANNIIAGSTNASAAFALTTSILRQLNIQLLASAQTSDPAFLASVRTSLSTSLGSLRDLFSALRTVALTADQRTQVETALDSMATSLRTYIDDLGLQSPSLVRRADTTPLLRELAASVSAGLSLPGVVMSSSLYTDLGATSGRAIELLLTEIGQDLMTNVDFEDICCILELLQGNSTLFSVVADAVSININSVAIDELVISDALESTGLSNLLATALADDLGEFVNPAEQLFSDGSGGSRTVGSVIESALGGTSSYDALNNTLTFSANGNDFPVFVISASVAPEAFPEGDFVLPDGSHILVSNGLAIRYASAPADTVEFAGGIEEVGGGVFSTDIQGNGLIRITDIDTGVSLNTVISDAGSDSQSGSGSMAFEGPAITNPANPNFSFTAIYGDGTRQRLQPAVGDPSLFDSISAVGFDVATDRSNGYLLIDGLTFRPDYYLFPLSEADQDYLTANADASGVAYRTRDVNGDGAIDVEVITASGVQIVYQVP